VFPVRYELDSYVLFRGESVFIGLRGQCPLDLLLEVLMGKDKALGSEEAKHIGYGLSYEQRREVELWLYCI
jgi:hypothetical protein